MERYTKEEQDLMKMDILDSFNEADRFDWLRYVFISNLTKNNSTTDNFGLIVHKLQYYFLNKT